MKKLFVLSLIVVLAACNKTTYYIVRHAEKEPAAQNMSTDVPLSADGKERAIALAEKLKDKNIGAIYTTNTIRTRATAQPLSNMRNIVMQTYNAGDTTFVSRLKDLRKGSVLIVGHSNTVDDLVNRFVSEKRLTDLPETQFGDMFIITRKGQSFLFRKDHFGK